MEPPTYMGVGYRPPYTPLGAVLFVAPHLGLLCALSLPPTSFLRPAVFAPAIIFGLWYTNLSYTIGKPVENVGMGVMAAFWSLRILELLVFVPPELNGIQRWVPASIKGSEAADKRKAPAPNGTSSSAPSSATSSSLPSPSPSPPEAGLVLEPIPAPYTWAKFCWAAALWGTYRGIGWTHQCPLSAHALRDPFLRTSSLRAFYVNRLQKLAITYLVLDILATIIALEPKNFAYFSAVEGAAFLVKDQTILWRGWLSFTTLTLTWQSLEVSFILTSLFMITVGVVTGWKGAMWEPWGYPALFGTANELWERPGIATLWSKTWHGYFRRPCVVLVWEGIGEKILGLKSTPSASRPPSETSTPTSDGVSTNSPPKPKPKALPITTRQLLSNLVKSLLVFSCTGLLHEAGNLSIGVPVANSYVTSRPIIGTTTIFFALQPLAIGAEALVKGFWRQWKGKHAHGRLGPHAQTVERLVGFCWTWWWLGESSLWAVEDWSKRGFYSQPVTNWSVIRWVWKGTFWV